MIIIVKLSIAFMRTSSNGYFSYYKKFDIFLLQILKKKEDFVESGDALGSLEGGTGLAGRNPFY